MSLFISNAYAAQGAAPQGQQWMSLAMLVVFLLVFYFLLWRPQAKRAKEHRQLIESISAGNEVVFAGGLMGRVKQVQGDMALVELNPNNVIKVQKASIISVLPEGTLTQI